MSGPTIRSAYPGWPRYQAALRAVVAGLTAEQLAIRPTPYRWPLWATIGHLACQRVSGLCGLLGEPGAESTPFPDAPYRCPGDEYLEPVLTGPELLVALDSTFAIIDGILDRWTFGRLREEVVRDVGGGIWRRTRGEVLQKSLAHDLTNIAEINETLSRAGLAQIDLWG